MQQDRSVEETFAQAEALFQAGKAERASLIMTDVIARHAAGEVRERAYRLFRHYAGMQQGRPDKERRPTAGPARPLPTTDGRSSGTPPAAPEQAGVPDKQATRQFILALAERRKQRLQDVSIPAKASLPTNFVGHIRTYLRLVHGRSADVPVELRGALETIRQAVSKLAPTGTQLDVCTLLRSTWERFPQTADGANVFAAIVTALYANDYLSPERARDLLVLAPNAPTRGRTLHELLTSDE